MKNYKIYPGVKIGKNALIGDFAVIGVPAKESQNKAVRTIIGDNAVLRSHTVIYAGNIIGNNFQTGHAAMIREYNKIGNNVSIGSHSIVEHHVKIGNGARIHSQVFVPEYSILEERCWIGPKATLTNTLHPFCPKAKECLKGPRIKKGAKIGANSTILPDLSIGKNSLVGAGSVVVKNVPDNTVVIGNPAKPVKKIKDLKCAYRLIERPYR